MILIENNREVAKKIASKLLGIGAIKLNPGNPFTWASGWKSPIYCDNRRALSFPSVRTFIKENMVKAINEHFGNVQTIAGVATAGIPQGMLVANELDLPFVYVRSSPKGHGLENLIEGFVQKGHKVVVIEDLISTGGSSLKAVQALADAGFEVIGMVSIFTYGFPIAENSFIKANVPFISLSDYDALIEEAQERQFIGESEIVSLKSWRKAPDQWGK